MSGLSDSTQISLGFVGDVCLSLGVIDIVRRCGAEYLFERVRPLYEPLDLVVGNLECCITDNGGPVVPTRPPLLVPSDVARALVHSNIDVFDLANNHVMDFGADGLRSTLDFLKQGGFSYFGAGMNLADAEAPLHIDVAGKRAAFLGACDVTASWAGPNTPGTAPMDERRLVRRVGEARQDADLLIVVLHADLEFVRCPAPHRRRLSRSLIDHGAAMVVQHHPHVCQGIERYKDGVIAYSLGNHVFNAVHPYQVNHAGTDESMLLQVDVTFRHDESQLAVKVHQLKIEGTCRPVPCEVGEEKERHKKLEELNRQILSSAEMRACWRSACRTEIRRASLDLYYAARRDGPVQATRDLARLLRTREHRRWIYGFLTGGLY